MAGEAQVGDRPTGGKGQEPPQPLTPPRRKGSGRQKKMDKRQVVKFPVMTAAELQSSMAALQVVFKQMIQHMLQKHL